jgi:hypothetical protein
LKGEYISTMIKIAVETVKAPKANAISTVELRGANRPMLAKIAASHETTTTKSGTGIEFCCVFRNICHCFYCIATIMGIAAVFDEPDWLDLLPCGLERVVGGQACCAVVATTGNRDQAVVLYPG